MAMGRYIFLPLLAAALSILIACGGDSEVDATPTIPPTPPATLTPTPTVTPAPPTGTPTPTPAIPAWLNELIQQMEGEPVANPPAYIAGYEYKGQTVYFLPQRCCDIFSVLYDTEGNVIAHPDGGITGQGDGRGPDFFEERTDEKIIWEDPRLTFQTVATDQHSGIELDAPQLFKIESQAQWQEFWVRHTSNVTPVPPLPPVDFDQEMIIAAVDQFQPSGGYALQITDVLQTDDGLTVLATRKEPGPECITPAVITHPFHIVRLAKSDLQLVLAVTSVEFGCQEDY